MLDDLLMTLNSWHDLPYWKSIREQKKQTALEKQTYMKEYSVLIGKDGESLRTVANQIDAIKNRVNELGRSPAGTLFSDGKNIKRY